jgi:hypothetical protein
MDKTYSRIRNIYVFKTKEVRMTEIYSLIPYHVAFADCAFIFLAPAGLSPMLILDYVYFPDDYIDSSS